ncbi:MAG TPA: type II toxin-antitoxin system RelE/ParE family toxin [Candidatus Acidoferrum sp.]|nr:type II toxin-antitoxin system RelE/ParE family toxin [Candidatus Acidoferrum sp.]
MRYRVSEVAERDLEEIFVYWAERANVDIADRLMDGIAERFWLLGKYPDAGRSCEDIAAGVKCFPAGRYLIYRRKSRQGTEILHIFHGTRDQKRAIKKAKKQT